MRTFPIMLAVGDLRAVVVGGGSVGLRKARALLAAGADVTLIEPKEAGGGDSPRFSEKHRKAGTVPTLRKRGTAPNRLRMVRARYKPSHLRGAKLVMACTDDRELNRRIAADARATGALVNAADQPEACDFYLPAVVARGDVVVAIGTGGSAPALAASLKRIVAGALPPKTGSFALALARLRTQLRDEIPDPHKRMAIMKRVSRPEGYREFLAGGAKALRILAGRSISSRAPAKRTKHTAL